jgi:hypothetical protein
LVVPAGGLEYHFKLLWRGGSGLDWLQIFHEVSEDRGWISMTGLVVDITESQAVGSLVILIVLPFYDFGNRVSRKKLTFQ